MHLVATLAEVAAQNVDSNECSKVPDVTVVVYGGAAGIHSHLACMDNFEILDCVRECVVETKRHR
jgi:hypothetical protein